MYLVDVKKNKKNKQYKKKNKLKKSMKKKPRYYVSLSAINCT